MTRVERLDAGPLDLDSTVRITQPKLPATVWQVTEFVPGVSFSWTATGPGIRTVGGHHVVAETGGSATVVLSIEQCGLLSPLVWLFTGGLTRRYVEMEAQGLKRRCEH
jgi:hypothetical protein